MSYIKGIQPLAPFYVEHESGSNMVFIDFANKFFFVQGAERIDDYPTFAKELEDLVKNHQFANWPKVDITAPEINDIVDKVDDKKLEAKDRIDAC